MVLQSEQFSYCQPWMLAWGYRKQNLVAELVAYNADIMCLQVRHQLLPSSKYVLHSVLSPWQCSRPYIWLAPICTSLDLAVFALSPLCPVMCNLS